MASDSGSLPATNGNPSKTLGLTAPPSDKPDPVENSTSLEAALKTKTVTAAPVSDAERKMRRAERFGITVQLSEQEKRNSRAERFNTVSSPQGTEASKQSDEELKRKARAERFGILAPTDNDAKKKSRLERFAPASKADALEEDKRKARAIRFSQSPLSSLSTNGKGGVEPKAPIAGKASGGS